MSSLWNGKNTGIDFSQLALEEKQYQMRAKFEAKTNDRFALSSSRRNSEIAMQMHLDQLDNRREQLRQLFRTEHQQYLEQFASKQPSKESKTQELKEKLAKVKAEKEADRQALAEAKKKEHFRLNCDELRLLESKILATRVAEERGQQLVEHQVAKRREIEERKYYDDLWEQNRQEKIQREEREKLQKQHAQEDMLHILAEQMSLFRERISKEMELKREEAKMMLEQIEVNRLEDERKQRLKLNESIKIRAELDRFNRAKLRRKAKAMKESVAFDLAFLDAINKRDDERKDRERTKQQAFIRNMMEYREHLLEQQRLQKLHEQEIEELIHESMAVEWKKQDEKWDKDQRQRDKLMKEIMDAREENYRYKLAQNQAKQEQMREEEKKIEAFLEEDRLRQVAKQEFKQKQLNQYRLDLASQIKDLKQRRLAEEQRLQNELDAIKREEEKYMILMKQELEEAAKAMK